MARPRKTDPASHSPFHARLNSLKLLNERDSDFAERLGLSQGGLSRILGGGKPDFDTLIAIANKCSVSVQWLATGDSREGEADDSGDVVLLRHIDVRPSAGPGRMPIVGEIESIHMPRDILSRLGLSEHNARVMRGLGTSMEPTIRDGELMLIDARRKQPVDNQVFVFSIGDDLFVKRLRSVPGEGWIIVSDNPDVPSTPFPHGEHIRFYGRVVWTERRL